MRNLSYEVDNILIVNDAINRCSSEKFLKDERCNKRIVAVYDVV